MKTSVALCTYNGEKYLQEQLDSIMQQNIPVNEIVVCDDGSTDTTMQILDKYQQKYSGIFRIFSNEENLRSVKNFEKAISLCTNEIIFLSDQDDIWMPNKTEIMLRYFSAHPDIAVLCSNGYGIDGSGRKLDIITVWDVPQFLRQKKIDLDYFRMLSYVGNIATGATMAIRRDFRDKLVPFPVKHGFHHDEWMALVASYHNKFDILPNRLISYRVHQDQQVGGISYPNNQETKSQLIRFFNLFGHDKNFAAYKKLLKRLAESYHKAQDLVKNGVHHDLIDKQLSEIVNLYQQTQDDAKRKYPIRFSILSRLDKLTGKRKLKP